ncbi:hypothetical protein SAMN02745164_01908, partial [Marinitoga hydrogenitolerans DSM 16785]
SHNLAKHKSRKRHFPASEKLYSSLEIFFKRTSLRGMLSKTILPEVKLKNKQKISTEKDVQ